MTVYGYARVSSRGQDLSDQIEQLEAYGCDQIFKEKKSGTKLDNRPEYLKLRKALKDGDKLVCVKWDRLARNMAGAVGLREELKQEGVQLLPLDMAAKLTTDENINDLLWAMLAWVAQDEAKRIRDRMESGKRYAKKHNPNYHEGGKLPPYDMVAAFLNAHANGTPVAQYAAQIGKSRVTLYRWLKRYSNPEELAKLPK